MAETKTKKAPKPKTDLETMDLLDDRRVYGPFDEWEAVTTQFGEYGLAPGLRLSFEPREMLNKSTLQMEVVPGPVYFDDKGKHVHGNGVDLETMRARAKGGS